MTSKCVKWDWTEYVFELHFTYKDNISRVGVYLLFGECSSNVYKMTFWSMIIY